MMMFSSSFFCCLGHGSRIGSLQLLRFSSSSASIAAANPSCLPPPKAHHFIVDYLVDKLGFSSEKAIKAFSYLSHLKSIERPESFVGFMRSHGFSDAQIKKMASFRPRYLLLNVEKTLAPKFQSLKDVGFSESNIVHLLSSNYRLLSLNFNRNLLPRIQFWQGLLGSRDHLVRLLKNNQSFLGSSIEKCVMPNLSFLRGCGVSDERIAMVARHNPRFITQNPNALVATADRAEKELGVPRSSGMFLWALRALNHASNERFNANIELMKKFGWTKPDFLSAFRKAPFFLDFSKKTLARKMEFLLKEAGCLPSDIAQRPVLLMCSLEKRLVPRHHVFKILKSKGLLPEEHHLCNVMYASEKVFMNRFIIRHKRTVPELQEIYMRASKGSCFIVSALL